jgi:hypothetical protein
VGSYKLHENVHGEPKTKNLWITKNEKFLAKQSLQSARLGMLFKIAQNNEK